MSLRQHVVPFGLLVALLSTQQSGLAQQGLELPGLNPGSDLPSSPIPGTGNPPSSPIPGVDDLDPSCDGGGGRCDSSSDVGSAPNGNLPARGVGNPIDLMTGNKHQREVDFEIPGAMLSLVRMYNSGNSESNRGLGLGWHHAYSVSLSDAGNGNRDIVQSNGGRIRFTDQGTDENGRPLHRANQPNHGLLTYENERHHWHLPDGRVLTFNGSFLVRIDWPDQRELKLFYRSKRLSTVTDETGRALTFHYAGEGRAAALPSFEKKRFTTATGFLEGVTLPDGSEIGYDYDNNRNLTRVRFPDNTTREYHYENTFYPHHLTGLTDRSGVRFATWSYDEEGRATSSEHAGGAEKVTLVYPDRRRAANGEAVETALTNSLGAESVFVWQQPSGSAEARLLSTSGAGCATCPKTGYSYAYDEQGRLSSSNVSGGGTAVGEGQLKYEYDEKSRLISIHHIKSDGRTLVEQREYLGNNLLPETVSYPSVNPQGRRTLRFERNAQGLPVKLIETGYAPFVTLPAESDLTYPEFLEQERLTLLEYEAGRLVSINGPRKDVDDITRLQWDERARLVAIAPPVGPVLRLERYDALGLPTRFQVGDAPAYEMTYDTMGNLTSLMNAYGEYTFDWNGRGQLLSASDPDGYEVRHTYDSAGRKTESRDSFGRRTSFQHNTESQEVGRSLFGIDGSLIASLQTAYDTLGRVDRQRTESADTRGRTLPAREFEFSYGITGVLASIINAANGSKIQIEIDSGENVSRMTRPGGTVSTHQFDEQGQEAGLLDAGGTRTRHVRDDFGQIVATVNPDTGTERLERDTAGNVVRRIREDSGVTTYERNALGQVLSRLNQDGTITHWSYDATNGRLVEMIHGQSTERFSYDKQGLLIEHERLIGRKRFVTRYERDAKGRIVGKRLSDRQRLKYEYHKFGLLSGTLSSITRAGFLGLGEQTVIAEVDLESRDGGMGWTAHNGIRTQYDIATNGRFRSVRSNGLFDLRYEYDSQGRPSALTENGETTQYSYSSGRLTQAIRGQTVTRYKYDVAGNRTSRQTKDKHGETSTDFYRYAVDSSPNGGNRLLEHWIHPGADITRYKYSSGGMPDSRGDLTYTYDAERRPVSVSRDGILLAQYVYNASGERVSKTVHTVGEAATTTLFLYENARLSAEISSSSEQTVHYLYVDENRLVAKLEGRRIFSIHGDHLGTPRRMADGKGDLVWSAQYDPFGQAEILVAEEDLPLRFPGQYEDKETGDHYNYFRDYSPATGRYLSSDPIGLAAGPNTYLYVSALPTAYIDPLGLRQTRPTRTYANISLNSMLNQMSVTQLVQTIQTIQPSFTYSRMSNVGGSVYTAQEVYNLSMMLQGYQLSQRIQSIEADFRLQGAISQADLDVLADQYEAMTYIDHIRKTQDPSFSYDLIGITDTYLDDLYEQATTVIEGQCTALWDPDYTGMTDIRALDELINAQPGKMAGVIVDGAWFPSQIAADIARSEYDNAGGRAGTGMTFAEWVEAGMPGRLVAQQSMTPEQQRALLRSAVNSAGTGKVAHHVVPLEALRTFPDLLRKAAEGGFDINGLNNGIVLDREDHIGGHPQYNAVVLRELRGIRVSLSPARLARELQRVADKLIEAIENGTFGPWG